MPVEFTISPAYAAQYDGVAFGLTLISGCENPADPPEFDQYRRKLLRKMRKRERLADITKRVKTYERFFENFGYPCPLPKHLQRTINSGFPKYNLMVDSHFMAEMCAGILVAVADYDRVDGALTLDLAEEGETCRGMGERRLVTRRDEIVLRDEKEIICILCQGADEKTRVEEDTRNVLFYAYAVPGIDGRDLREGLTIAADTMVLFGEGTVERLEIF